MTLETAPFLITQSLLIGVLNGGIYVLMGLGLTLLFGVSRIVNMAHGEFFAAGGYVTFVVATVLGVSPVAGLAVAIIGGMVFGWLLDRGLIAPLRRRPKLGTPLEFFLILTLGLSLVMQNGLLVIFGPNNLETPPTVRGTVPLPGGITISQQRLLNVAIAAVLVVGLFLFLNRTRIGTAIRAVSQDRNSAMAVGINVATIDSLVFGLSAAFGAAAGSLTTAVIFLYPTVGTTWLIGGFVAVIAGGLGNPVGTLVAGYSLGILEALSVLVLPAQLKTLVGLLIMIAVMIFRPAGLLGRRSAIAEG